MSEFTAGEFDGEHFAEFIILTILIVLFFFGSTDIDTLSTQPTSSSSKSSS
ncbi:hypothetical protein ACFQ5D_15940 [Paenibacillus farraposensis]|uniref:Uncharacterized protein n=1 Tax=Paenibacillus farraposensis TaxID=2807095 RepID=A0ABW4DHZ0_9BACL|nr:hypothetical protein [Paenibacillus farraposensis]MCC3380811.1 hypothetical protein [Paenibacillus farraposensis]